MAKYKKMTDEEIDSYIKSKQMSSEDYVAPQVRVEKANRTVTPNKITKVNSNTSNLVSQPTVEVKQTVTMPKINTVDQARKNYNEKLSVFNKASEAYDKKRVEELNKANIDLNKKFEKQDFKDNIKDGQVNKKSVWEKEKEYEAFEPTLQELTEPERQAQSTAKNDLKLARYQKNLAEVENEDVNELDRIVNPFVSGIGDIFSTVMDDNKYINENGEVVYLPSINDLKYQKVRESYGDDILGNVRRFLGDVKHEVGKQSVAQGLNAVTGGKGGQALYFSDIIADQYKQNINEGYGEHQALGDALLKGGSNYIKQKIIGGFGKKLTGDTSWLENKLTNTYANAISDPRILSMVSSMSAEALDEFTDTYVEAGIDAFVLGKDFNAADLFVDALYSGAVGGATGAGSGAVSINPEVYQALENRQNRINQNTTPTVTQNVEQNVAENVEPTIRTETPQIETKPVESTNTQETPQTVANELKTTNNNVLEIKQPNTRTSEDISNRKVNAYQYDNPSVRPFYRDAALDLRQALDSYTNKADRWMTPDGEWMGTKFSSTPEITELKNDYNMSYKEMDRGIDGIIKDNGDENNAASKKVEKVIDKMLRNGYRSETPDTTTPNQAYLDTLAGKQVTEQADEDLPFFTGNEEEDRRNFPELKNDEKLTIKELADKVGANKLNDTVDEYIAEPNKYSTKEAEVEEMTPQQKEQELVDEGVEPKAAKVLSEMPEPEKKSMSQKIKEGKATLREEWSYFKRNFVDKGETIYTLSKKLKRPKLYAKYDKMGTTRGEANYSIGKGQQNLQGKLYNNFTDKNGKKVSMSLNDIWEGVDAKVANQYLADWLNVDRYNQQTEDGKNKYVYGIPDINPELSKQRIAQLEKSNPELKRFGENVWQYGKNMLQNMVDGGLISKEQAEQFQRETPHYVRLQRNAETNKKSTLEINSKNRTAKVNKPTSQEFKGSNLDILPFKNSMADYTFQVAQAIRTNLFAQELAQALSVGSTDNEINSLDESFGIRPELLKDNGDGTYSLTLFNKGVATVIPIDQGIYESLTPSKHYNFEDKLPFKGIRKVDSFRKALLTDKNPMFLATNMMKDAFDAPLNSKYPVAFAKNYPRAIKEIMTNGKYYQQYQALGGLQNTYFDKSGFQKEGSKVNPLTWIEKGNNAIEQFPRLAEFISTMEKTGDIDEAMYNAAEITTNFKRGGDVTKAANRNGVTFLNASVQGFDKQIRNFTDISSPRQAVQLLGKIVVLGIAPAIINDVMYKDDEEYQDMQDYIKDRYYLFKGKDGDWIRIPKGRAVSVFQSAARRTGYALKGDDKAFEGFANFASTQVAPNNPFENNIVSPLVDVARNESWSGNKIVSDSLRNKEHPEEEFNEKTDEFSKWLGQQTKTSPMMINYLLDQYSGGVGDVVLPMITPKTTSKANDPISQAFASKFTADSVYSNKNLSVFYDTKQKYEDEKKSVNGTQMDKLKYSYLNSQNMKIAELRKEQSAIQSDKSLSNEEKYKQAREIQKQINELSKQSVKDIENIQDNKYYAIVGDNTYYLDSDGSFKKDAYADSHKKSADKKGMALYDYYKEQYEKRKEKNK